MVIPLFKWIYEAEKDENSKIWQGRISSCEMVVAKMGTSSAGSTWRKYVALYPKYVSKSLKYVRLKLRFDGENESFSAECIWNRMLLSEYLFQYTITEE
jgi:hypothetical protein